jgi:hypothetical protein
MGREWWAKLQGIVAVGFDISSLGKQTTAQNCKNASRNLHSVSNPFRTKKGLFSFKSLPILISNIDRASMS